MSLRIPLISDAWDRLGQALQNDLEGIKSEARQLDAFSKQTNSLPAKLALKVTGLAYAAATLPQRMTAPLAYGVVDFPAAVISDPVATAQSIPASVHHNGSAMVSGGADIYNGNISAGFMNVSDGFWGDFIMCAPLAKGMTTLGVFKKATPVAETPFARQLAATAQKRADVILSKITAEADAAFVKAWENTAVTARSKGAELGALVIPKWMLPALDKADYVKLFRQVTVSNADLEILTRHADHSVSKSARDVLWERTATIPEGYTLIPGGDFISGELAGVYLDPFAMKKTPVTNVEWRQGLDGHKRFIALAADYRGIVIKDISAKPPRRLAQDFEASDIFVKRSNVYLKLVDNPSLTIPRQYGHRVLNRDLQPVVGVTYFHAQAWLQLQTLKAGGMYVYRLPSTYEYKALFSDFGREEYSLQAKPRSLTYNYGDGYNSDVNMIPADRFGVQIWDGVWRLMDGLYKDPFYNGKLKGGNSVSALLDAWEYPRLAPNERTDSIGFSPVVVPKGSKY